MRSFLVFIHFIFCFFSSVNLQSLFGVKKTSDDDDPRHPTIHVAQDVAKVAIYGKNLSPTGFYFAVECDDGGKEIPSKVVNFFKERIIIEANFSSAYNKAVYNICHPNGIHFSSILSEAGHVSFVVQKETYDIWQRLGMMAGCVLLIMLSATFSGLNFSLICLSVKHLELIAQHGNKGERKRAKEIIKLRKYGNWIICTYATLNVFVNTVFTILFKEVFPVSWGMGKQIAEILIPAFFIVAFGELTPQVICHRRGLVISWLTRDFTWFCLFALSPVCYPAARLINCFVGEEMVKYTKVETMELVSQNIRSTREEEFLKRIQNLQKTVVSQVHTPVEDIFRLTDKDILDEKLLFVIAEKGYTRVPIFETDNLMRYVLNTRDLLTVPLSPPLTIEKFLSGFDKKPEIRVVLADTPVIVVLIEMLKTQNHMYAVVRCDGPSQLLGYVSLEDLMEEVFGEIQDGSDSVWSKNRRAKPHEDQSVLTWLKEPIGPGEIPQPAKLNLIQMLFAAYPKLKEKGFDVHMVHQAMNSSVLYQTKRDTIVCRKGGIIKKIFVIYVGGVIVDKNNYIAPIIYGIELLKELCETEIYRNREILAVSQNNLVLQKGTVFYWLSPSDLLNQMIVLKKKRIAKEFFIGTNSQIKVESLSQMQDLVPAEFESLTNKQHPSEIELQWKECEKKKTLKHFCKQLSDETREWTINEERVDDTQFDTETSQDSERIQRSNAKKF